MNIFKQLRKSLGLTQIQLAKILNVEQATISKWEVGKSIPDTQTLKNFANYFNVTVDYLLGRDSKVIPFPEQKKDPVIKDEVPIRDEYPVPLVGRVVAGIPVDSAEYLEGYVYVGYKNAEEYFALRVHGDSMINAGITENAILIVHKQNYAEDKDVVIALVNGEQTVKSYRVYSNNVIMLMPENKDYEPIPITEKTDFVILGVVVECRTSMKRR